MKKLLLLLLLVPKLVLADVTVSWVAGELVPSLAYENATHEIYFKLQGEPSELFGLFEPSENSTPDYIVPFTTSSHIIPASAFAVDGVYNLYMTTTAHSLIDETDARTSFPSPVVTFFVENGSVIKDAKPGSPTAITISVTVTVE